MKLTNPVLRSAPTREAVPPGRLRRSAEPPHWSGEVPVSVPYSGLRTPTEPLSYPLGLPIIVLIKIIYNPVEGGSKSKDYHYTKGRRSLNLNVHE